MTEPSGTMQAFGRLLTLEAAVKHILKEHPDRVEILAAVRADIDAFWVRPTKTDGEREFVEEAHRFAVMALGLIASE